MKRSIKALHSDAVNRPRERRRSGVEMDFLSRRPVVISAYHGVDYLLTWNCRHIDNAEMKPLMRSVCAVHGYSCPEICTPLELMGEDNEG